MPTNPTSPAYESTLVSARHAHPLCWGAVFAGAIVALAAHLLVTLFAIGLGVQFVDPLTDSNPAAGFGIGAGVAWSVSALLSLWLGGCVAGRLAPEPSPGLGRLHGLLVWSVATVAMAFFLTGGVGALAGGVAKLTGKGVEAVGRAGGAAIGASGDAISRVVEDNSDLLGSFASELSGAPAGDGEAGARPADPRARREVSWALVRFFSADEGLRNAEARAALVKAVADNTDLDEAEASRRVDEWVASYDRIQQDMRRLAERAEQKAREAADAAADYLTHVAVWTFIAFLVGAIAAACGGNCGARCRRRNDPDATVAA